MKIPVSKLEGVALDWAVAKCECAEVEYINDGITKCLLRVAPFTGRYAPSTDWSQGGPLIEREECWPSRYYGAAESRGKVYQASAYNGSHAYAQGPTPLIAAMRCYVASKLGNEVEVPEELL